MSKYNVIKWDHNLLDYDVLATQISDYESAHNIMIAIADEQKIDRLFLDIEIVENRKNLFCGGYLGA